MAYRDPTFNANLFTDLLSTYLENQSSEREKYYKAEQARSRPQFKAIGTNIVEIDPMTRQTRVIYEGPKKQTAEKLVQVTGEEGEVTLQPRVKGMRIKPAPKTKTLASNQVKLSDVISFSKQELKGLKNIRDKKTDLVGRPIDFDTVPFGNEQIEYHENVLKNPRKWFEDNPNKLPVFEFPSEKDNNTQVKEVRRIVNNRVAIFNPDTEEFIRYE